MTLTRLPISSNSSQLLSPSPSSQESKRTGRRVAKAATIKSGAKQSASSKVAAGLKTRLNKFRAEVAKSAHKFRLEKLKRCVKEHLNKTKMEKDLKGHADVDGRIRRSRPFSSLRITGAIRNPSKTSLQRSLSLPKNGGHLTEVIRSKSPASNSCSKGTSMLASLNLEDSASVSSTAFLHSACLHRQSTLDSDWCHCQHGVQSGNSCSVLRCAQSPQKSLMKEIRSPHAKDYTSERKLNGFESTDIVSSLRLVLLEANLGSQSIILIFHFF